MANKVVQTGPNTHDGGFKAGFTSIEYQPSIEGVVKIEPIIPASSETTIAMMSFMVLGMFLLYQKIQKLKFNLPYNEFSKISFLTRPSICSRICLCASRAVPFGSTIFQYVTFEDCRK